MSFFETKRAAAILKHSILEQYIEPFTMKAGKFSLGSRVAFVDGYAGEGRYDDGKEGSPALVLERAKKLAPKRHLECYFVERDAATLAKLRGVVQAEGTNVTVETFHGDVENHLDSIMAKVRNIPVFVFLDPFGLMIPFDKATKVFDRPRGLGSPATEMLINFNAGAIRRIAGHLTSPNENQATLARMDAVCGGGWWRQVWLEALPDRDAAEESVVNAYADHLARVAKCGYWTTDVRNRTDLKPAYHLVFLSRHQDGLYLFGESLSRGLERWRQITTTLGENENEVSLFDPVDLFNANEKALTDSWVNEIEANLRKLLGEGESFQVLQRYDAVFGKATGKAREKHLRVAWKKLYEEGVTKTDSKGKLILKQIDPA